MKKIAIIETGGRQYRVRENDIIKVNKLSQNPGDKVNFVDILEKQNVTGELIEQKKDKKVLVFKHHKRKRYIRKKGHRQVISVIKISNIKSKNEKDI